MPIRIQCGDPVYDALPHAFAEWWAQAALSIANGTQTICGARSDKRPRVDLREYSLSSWGGAFYENDVRSAIDVFLAASLPDGSLFDSFEALPTDQLAVTQSFDDHLQHLRFSREPLNADTPSCAVIAAYRAWQTSNDTSWLLARLPVLQRALEHSWVHPQRWSSELELPKREFTLDRWPLKFGKAGYATSAFNIEHEFPCVYAGDAAHLHRACLLLAKLCAAVGQVSDEEKWLERASHVQAQLNSVGWNGTFYTHQVHLQPVRVRGVDEARQLAACNALAMNCGVADAQQCASILREYSRRRELNLETSFCEWWSIQPSFALEHFGVEPGVGANGGVWPLVGGELARAAFANGYESYGVETLRRYYELAVVPRRSWATYDLKGAPLHGEHAVSYDVVGASAMLRALIEGVCGVRDDGAIWSGVTLSPRWPATGQSSAEVEVSYAANPAYVSYRWALDGGRMTLDYETKAKHVAFDLMLPRGNTPERVALNGRTHEYSLVTIEKSKYVRFETDKKRGAVAVTLK